MDDSTPIPLTGPPGPVAYTAPPPAIAEPTPAPPPTPVTPTPPAPEVPEAPKPPEGVIVLGGHSLDRETIAAKYKDSPDVQAVLLANAEAAAVPQLTEEARRIAERAARGNPAIRVVDAEGMDIDLGDCGCDGEAN